MPQRSRSTSTGSWRPGATSSPSAGARAARAVSRGSSRGSGIGAAYPGRNGGQRLRPAPAVWNDANVTDHRPWFAGYPEGVAHSLEPYPEMSAFGMLENAARKHPEATAVAWFGKKITYRYLLAEVERCSAALAGLGIAKGDRVSLVMPNCPHYFVAYYATIRLGAIIVANNPLYTKRERAHQLRDR